MLALVSVDWLSENLKDSDLVLLDASLNSTAEGKSSELYTKTLPGARAFDLKKNFSDHKSPFPNTMPAPDKFETECQKLGINKSTKIVVFDNMGIYSSPRVWWMFRAMGHEKVAVLNGGLPEWIAQGLPVEDKNERNFEPGDFQSYFKPHWIKSYTQVLENVSSQSFDVIDARSEGRFNGTQPEPRKTLKSGHIPSSINIPYSEVLEHGKLKSENELKSIFKNKCFNEREFVFSCGSGLTACIVMLACEVAYKKSHLLFDGSWTEWAERQNLRIKNS